MIGGFIALQTPGGADFVGRVEAPEASQASRAPVLTGLIVPVSGVRPEQLVDSWHDPREAGARVHEALDIMAAGGTPVVAAMAGTVEKLFQSARGGTTIYVRSNDSLWIAYYAHLTGYVPSLHEGQHVGQGEQIGFVGDTGDAGAGNFHLHFALQRMQPSERWWQGTPVNPYPLLAGKAAAR
ncbi:MAG: M23 family metallopeptidase [Sphingomonadaceae bacterium]|nr:M23 family metallopeptidase [Sphingomonadaceae bacterium]